MCFYAVFLKAAHAEVVYADRLHAGGGDMPCAILCYVNEVLIKIIALPTARGVACLEQDTFAALQVVRLELGGGDGGLVMNFNHPTGSEYGIQRQGFHGDAAIDEVPRGIHVRTGMRAEAHVGEIARTAVGVANGLVQARLEPGITGPMHHAVANRNADVDPAHAEKLNPKTKIQNPKLIETAGFKVVFVHAEIMAELV